MGIEFTQPWLVIAASALVLLAGAAWWRRRRLAPVLFVLGAAAFALAGAGPRLHTQGRQVTHLAVLDVSDSMAANLPAAQAQLNSQLAEAVLPPGHSMEFMQISDVLRTQGAPAGGPTRLERLADAESRPGFNGELILMTDGRAELASLARGARADRTILLKPPPAPGPDAAISGLRGPPLLVRGSTGILAVDLFCDRDAAVRWRVMQGSTEIAGGVREVRANQTAGVSATIVAAETGLLRLRVQISLEGDREPRNDSAAFSVLVTGGRLIHYACDPSVPLETDSLHALLAADTRNEVRVRHDLPGSAELEGAALLVINDLPMRGDPARLNEIAEWVNSGGSLWMSGAQGAFAPGGYRGTPLEALMPVNFRPDDEPPRHVLLLLDVSASMAEAAPGGRTRLDVLKQAASGLVRALDRSDLLAIAGFHASMPTRVEFRGAGNHGAHDELIRALAPGGATRIHAAITAGLRALPEAARVAHRILIVTDGEEGDAIEAAVWRELGTQLAARNANLDAVLTADAAPPWLAALADGAGPGRVSVVMAGASLERLSDALRESVAAMDRSLVLRRDMEVGGVNVRLPVTARTSLRRGDRVTPVLEAQTPGVRRPVYPLLAYREMVGRTAVLCTESAGEQQLVDFWNDPLFREKLGKVLDLLLANAGRPNVVLHGLDDGHELVWVGPGPAPTEELRLEPVAPLVHAGDGRWRLSALPAGPELRVFAGARLLQRIALPEPVPPELTRTGVDPVFFDLAARNGYRVFESLAAWQPRRWGEAAADTVALDWAGALMAAILLLSGYAVRRR